MKISILCHSCLSFTGTSLTRAPLGGTETSVILFAKSLRSFGHKVSVYTNITARLDGDYYPVAELNNPSCEAYSSDVVISVRDYKALQHFQNAKARMFWTGDSYDQPFNVGMGDKRAAKHIDLFLAVSEWHRQTLCDASGFPLEKSWVIRNGIDLSRFQNRNVQRNRKRLIYSSMPYRGFALTPDIYSELVKVFPDIEFHAFTGFGVVQNLKNEQQVNELESTLEKLNKLPGFHYRGNVTQDQLAIEFLKSGILFYPNTFEETSCITAIEAMAAGCVPVTSFLGALPETISGNGYVVAKTPGTYEYKSEFFQVCCRLLKDQSFFDTMSENAKKHAVTYDWNNMTQNFLAEVKNRFNI